MRDTRFLQLKWLLTDARKIAVELTDELADPIAEGPAFYLDWIEVRLDQALAALEETVAALDQTVAALAETL